MKDIHAKGTLALSAVIDLTQFMLVAPCSQRWMDVILIIIIIISRRSSSSTSHNIDGFKTTFMNVTWTQGEGCKPLCPIVDTPRHCAKSTFSIVRTTHPMIKGPSPIAGIVDIAMHGCFGQTCRFVAHQPSPNPSSTPQANISNQRSVSTQNGVRFNAKMESRKVNAKKVPSLVCQKI